LLTAEDIGPYLADVLADGNTRAFPLALRTAADVLGMAELARRTGLNRETLYRTLSKSGNPRLDTLGTILNAFGMRLVVKRAAKPRRRKVSKTVKSKAAAQRIRKRA
jgi:probable addiction module antidote protein